MKPGLTDFGDMKIYLGPEAKPHKKQKNFAPFGASVLIAWRFGANPPKHSPLWKKTPTRGGTGIASQ